MAHNLEIRDGIASYAENGRRERAWHHLGRVFDHPMTVREALEASRADFEVQAFPLVALTPNLQDHLSDEGYGIPQLQDEVLDSMLPDKKVTVRMDSMTPLGVVSNSYGIVQNVDAFTFIDTICTGGSPDSAPVIECAGVLGRGERIFVTARFPDDIILDSKGDDRVQMNMVFTTSHDGTGSVKCVVTPVRVVCSNTLRLAMEHNCGCLSLRHSSNIMQRLDLASKENAEFAYKALNLMDVYKRSLEARLEHLRNIRVAEKDLEDILASVAFSDKDLELYRHGGIENGDIGGKARERFVAMREVVEHGVGQEYGERGTALWLINGITSFYQNNASFRNEEVKFDSILNGYTSKKVLKAVASVEGY